MRPHQPFLLLCGSAVLLVAAVVLLPVFEVDTPYNPRADVPPACTVAAGLVLAFLAARRLSRWGRAAAYLLLLLHGFLFVSLLRSLHLNA